MVNKKTFKKYKAYLNDELEAASIYNILAKSYINPDKASIFIKLDHHKILKIKKQIQKILKFRNQLYNKYNKNIPAEQHV